MLLRGGKFIVTPTPAFWELVTVFNWGRVVCGCSFSLQSLFQPSTRHFPSMAAAGVRWEPEEDARRKALILEFGLPCRTRVEVSGALLMIALEPKEGFPHLVQDVDACVAAYGPYHVSLCQVDLVSEGHMRDLCAAWEGRDVTLVVTEILGAGCLVLGGAILADPVVRRLHDHPAAWYCSRALHVSA